MKVWTRDKVNKLRSLHAGGASNPTIAFECGVSLSSAKTKIRDLGLSRDNAWPPERIEQLLELQAEGFSCAQIARQIGTTRNAVLGKLTRLGATNRSPQRTYQRRAVARAAAPPLPPIGPLNDFPDSRNECRFPYGEMSKGNFRCCGHPVFLGSSYCEAHFNIVFTREAANKAKGRFVLPKFGREAA